MARFKVVEKFVSINGEGRRAGQLAVFVRFKGCNLNCGYCDTKWANEPGAEFEYMSEDDVYRYIKKTRVKNVTLTGGEPLIQEGIYDLLEYLSDDGELRIEIETNGSVNLERFCSLENRPSFTMDYKLGLSGMEDKMDLSNFRFLGSGDTVKFVVGSREDLERARRIVEEYSLIGKCAVYLSPVFGAIEPKEIVDFMIENNLNDINLQLQLHKFIWAPNQKAFKPIYGGGEAMAIDVSSIEFHIREIIKALGDDPEREGLIDTPKRVAKMYAEVFDGMNYTNKEIAEMFNKTFQDDPDSYHSSSDLVIVKDIEAFSYCEHHMALMYNMKVSVAYIPNGKVIGLSKIARIVDKATKRLQLQERIGVDVAEIMQIITDSDDVAVIIDASHSCMTARGIQKPSAKTRTITLRGRFETDKSLQLRINNL